LHVVSLEVPALRARKEDIPLLATAFLKLHSANMLRRAQDGRTAQVVRLSRDAMDTLMRYDWPGNVRELKNALERSLVFARGEEITPEDLPTEITNRDGGVVRAGSEDESLSEPDFRDAKRKFEVAYITRQLERHKWNVSRTAATIGLHRQSLQEKLRELGIHRPGRIAAGDATED
jgi:DNA-binding NtrC family response regulator